MARKHCRMAAGFLLVSALCIAAAGCIDLSGAGGTLGGAAVGGAGGGLLGSVIADRHGRRGDAHGRDDDGRTALHEAAEDGHEKECERLLDRGAHVNARDDDGRTPLHLAAKKGHKDVCRILLKEGASAHIRDDRGKRPSELARDKGNSSLYRYLREVERGRRRY